MILHINISIFEWLEVIICYALLFVKEAVITSLQHPLLCRQ